MPALSLLAAVATCVAAYESPSRLVRRAPQPRASAAADAGWASRGSDASAGASGAAAGSGAPPPGRWQRIAGCDVLLPEDDVVAIVHFVGGAFAGAAPQQAYGPFLEALGSHGVAIVATPCTQLGGLSHWIASQEVSARWLAAEPELSSILAARNPQTPPLPVFGVGHSLGAKLLLLLSLAEGAPPELAPPQVGARAANVLLSYNNFAAARAVPLLKTLSGTDAFAVRSGAADAAAAFPEGVRGAGDLVGSALRGLGSNLGEGLESALGSTEASRFSRAAGDFLGNSVSGAADMAAEAAAGAASAASAGGFWGDWGDAAASAEAEAPDFSPSPAETDALVGTSYSVGRNLLLRFKDDELDQSPALGRILKDRFVHPEHGIGGKVELRSLEGTHITPNLPQLRSIDWSAAEGAAEALAALGRSIGSERLLDPSAAKEFADRLAFEQEVAAATVAAFVLAESKRT